MDLRVTVNALTYGGNTTNGFNITVKTQLTTGGTITTYYNTTYNPNSASNTLYALAETVAYAEASSYTVTITVKDDFSTVTMTGTLSTAAYPLVVSDEGIGVGKVPVAGRTLDVEGTAYIKGDVTIEGSLNTTQLFVRYYPDSNPDNITDEWSLGSNGSNWPSTGFWYLNTVWYAATRAKQMAYGYDRNDIYTRFYYNTWRAWVKVFKYKKEEPRNDYDSKAIYC